MLSKSFPHCLSLYMLIYTLYSSPLTILNSLLIEYCHIDFILSSTLSIVYMPSLFMKAHSHKSISTYAPSPLVMYSISLVAHLYQVVLLSLHHCICLTTLPQLFILTHMGI